MSVHNFLYRILGQRPPSGHTLERQIILSAQLLANENRKRGRIKCLADVEFSAFSQWGEDGIIDWLVEKIPNIPRRFVEFGVENYRESNTRLLLKLRNWRGLIIDSSTTNIDRILQQDVYWKHDLTALCAFVDRDNINSLIRAAGLAGEVGLLSIDIDGNDYWVWEAINVINPVIVVCEYNAVFGDLEMLSIPYQADFQRTKAHYSNLYFGASLPALVQLAQSKGYTLLGTNYTGANAFFLRNDASPTVIDYLEKICSFPSAFREARDVDGKLIFTSREDRLKLIGELEVYDFATKKLVPLNAYENLYSGAWRNAW